MTNSGAFGNRFLLFLDFLGTSAAIMEWPAERLHQFAHLLTGVRNLQRAETIDGEAQPDGSHKVTLTPEISTFSDHIAISYGEWPKPDEGGIEYMSHIQPDWICQDLIRYVSDIAAFGLRNGLLVRGAICFGDLYHRDGVVLGQAMLDAYRMESQEADGPRILVSNQVAQMVGSPEERPDLFLKDTADGRWHLNYFKNLPRHAADFGGHGNPNAFWEWKVSMLAVIDAEIQAVSLCSDEMLRERMMAKWHWFRERFIAVTDYIREA